VFLILLAAGARAQVGPEMRQAERAGGLTLSGPAAGEYFRMEITGRDAARVRTQKKYWYSADGVSFEFFSEETANFLMTDLPRRPADRVILDLYRSDFARRNPDLKLRSSWVRLAGGKDALLWNCDRPVASPDNSKEAKREMFLITTHSSLVFGLYATVEPGKTTSETRRELIGTLGTLAFSDKPY
jgi:hypothetical protein